MIELIVTDIAERILESGLRWCFEDELTQLRELLEMISPVLADVQRRQVRDMSVKLWLGRLEDVVYAADDMLDEIGCQMKRKDYLVKTIADPNAFHFKIANKVNTIADTLKRITEAEGYYDASGCFLRTRSSSGGFNSEEASRGAALKSNCFPDSSALRRSDRVDVDVDSDSIPEFNELVGLQAEAQDGGVMMLPNFNGDRADPHRSGESGERGDENSEEHVELSIPRPGTSLAEVRTRSFSSGAQNVVPDENFSSPLVVSHSEVPDLESGRGRWSTPGAGTSSQVIGLESGRERARSSNQRLIELGFAILLGSITAVVSIGVGELSSRNRFILNCVLVISIVGFVSLVAAFITLPSTPSTDTHTTQTTDTILARLGFAASAFGFILVIAMVLPKNLLWVIILALIALVFIFVKTYLARRPRI